MISNLIKCACVMSALIAISSGSVVAMSATDIQSDTSKVLASDAGFVITAGEFEYLLRSVAPNIRSEVHATDEARFELITSALASKKIMAQIESQNKTGNPDWFYRFRFAILDAVKELDEERFQSELVIPDLEKLAQERYRVSKQEIAQVPELRSVSHILLLCTEDCDREEKRSELQVILKQLQAGESFADLAIEYSNDPGSRQNGGRLSQPIKKDDERVDQQFRDVVFGLKAADSLSGIVETRFGLHVIRLNEIIPPRLYSFEEVRQSLILEVEKRYRSDAYREYLLTMGPGEDFVIDYKAIDSLIGDIPQY
jgi:peptidyl-prolyl cis-trans isomerase C